MQFTTNVSIHAPSTNHYISPEQVGNDLFDQAVKFQKGLDGVEKNFGKARQHFELAAEAGNDNAMFELGKMFGIDREPDAKLNPSFSAEWFNKASEQGHPEAPFQIARMMVQLNKGTQGYFDIQEAIDYCALSVYRGFEDARPMLDGLVQYRDRDLIAQEPKKSVDISMPVQPFNEATPVFSQLSQEDMDGDYAINYHCF